MSIVAMPPDAPEWLKQQTIGIKRFHDVYLRKFIEISGLPANEIERWRRPILAARMMELKEEAHRTIIADRLKGADIY